MKITCRQLRKIIREEVKNLRFHGKIKIMSENKNHDDLVQSIAFCIREGRELQMTSSEILEGVISLLEDAGIDTTSSVDVEI